MDEVSRDKNDMIRIAEEIREACIRAMKEGFQDASMSGLCIEGAIEAAIGAVQLLDLEEIVNAH